MLPDIKCMLLSTKYTRNKSSTKHHGVVKHLRIALYHRGTKYQMHALNFEIQNPKYQV